MSDVYQVTIWLGHSRDRANRWREHGRSGLTNAVESVDWEIRNGHGTCGIVERLNPSGGVAVEVYRRHSDPAPSDPTSGPGPSTIPAPAHPSPPATDLHVPGIIQFMPH